MNIYSEERRAAFVLAIKEYKAGLSPGRFEEEATRDGLNYSTLKSWERGLHRGGGPVPPLPNSLLLLFLATGSIVFVLLPEEVEACNASRHARFHVPPEMMELAKRRAQLSAQMSKDEAKVLVEEIRALLSGNFKPKKDKATPNNPACLPAYTSERLGEIADALEAYYRNALQASERDELIQKLKQRNWLRIRPENRKSVEKKNAGPGPEFMLELFQWTKNDIFILRPQELEIFRGRQSSKVVIPEEMVRLSEALAAGKLSLPVVEPKPVVAVVAEAVPAKKVRVPEKSIAEVSEEPKPVAAAVDVAVAMKGIFSLRRVEELAWIIKSWVNTLGTIEDPVDNRFEALAARMLGITLNDVFLLKTGKKVPTPEMLAKIYSFFPHERLLLTDVELASAMTAGLCVSEYGVIRKAEPIKPVETGDAQLLLQVDAKVQAILLLFEALVSRSPEMREALAPEKNLPLTKWITRQLKILQVTLVSLDGMVPYINEVDSQWRRDAMEFVLRLVRVFKLTVNDLESREPKPEDDPVLMATLFGIFTKGGKA